MSEENVPIDSRIRDRDSVKNSSEEAEVSGRLKLLLTCWNCGQPFYCDPQAFPAYCPNCGSALPQP